VFLCFTYSISLIKSAKFYLNYSDFWCRCRKEGHIARDCTEHDEHSESGHLERIRHERSDDDEEEGSGNEGSVNDDSGREEVHEEE